MGGATGVVHQLLLHLAGRVCVCVLWGEGLRVCGLGGDGGEVDVKWEVKTAREEGGGGQVERGSWLAVAGASVQPGWL